MKFDLRSRWGISLYFFCYYAALSLTFAFLPIILRARGFSYTQIGGLLLMAAVSGALVQMGIGYLSDHLSLRRPLICGAMVGLAIAFQIFGRLASYSSFLAFFAVLGIMQWSSLTLVTALVGDIAENSSSFTFATIRVFGSLGWVMMLAISIVAHALVQQSHLFLGTISIFFFLAGVSIFIAQEPPVHHEERPPLREAARSLVGSRNTIFFLASYLIFMLAMGSMNNFLPLYIKGELGLSKEVASRYVPLAFMISAACEMPFMLWFSRMSDRIGRRPLLLLAYALLPVRIFIVSQLKDPLFVLGMQAFHGLTWGIVMVLSVAFIAESVPAKLRASGQGLLTTMTAFAGGLWAVAAGKIGDHYSLATMLLVVSIISTGAFFLGLFLREPEEVSFSVEEEITAVES